MRKSSAMPLSKKIETLTQGVFRRMHNTKEEVDNDVKVEILNKFMEDIKVSGYNENERFNILKGGMKTYENLKNKSLSGSRPFYRPSSYQRPRGRRRRH